MPASRVLRRLLQLVCGYEFAAITSGGKVPPISRGLWRLAPHWRAVIWGGFVALLTDHLFTRKWS